jgi:hypothetical protein
MSQYSIDVVNFLLSSAEGSTMTPDKLFESLGYQGNEKVEFLLALNQLHSDKQTISTKGNQLMNWTGDPVAPILVRNLSKRSRCRLEASLVIAKWLLNRKFKDQVKEMGDRPFHECFEWLISKNKDFQWFQVKSNSADGGIDSYAEYRVGNKVIAYIVQAKATTITMPYVRNLLGTYTFLKRSPAFVRKWAPGLESSFGYHSCELVLMTSQPIPPKVRKEFLDHTSDFDARIKFHLIDPWDIAWIIASSADQFANRRWGDTDLPKLLKIIDMLAEDDNIYSQSDD